MHFLRLAFFGTFFNFLFFFGLFGLFVVVFFHFQSRSPVFFLLSFFQLFFSSIFSLQLHQTFTHFSLQFFYSSHLKSILCINSWFHLFICESQNKHKPFSWYLQQAIDDAVCGILNKRAYESHLKNEAVNACARLFLA